MKAKSLLIAAAAAFSLPAAAQTYISTDVPKLILDNRTLESSIFVPDSFSIASLTLQLAITHTWDGDLDLFLLGPTGTLVELSTDNGGSGDNYINTVFSDAATTAITAGSAPFTGTFRPEQPLSVFAGTNSLGQWRLRITDDAGGDSGQLHNWRLNFTASAIPEPQTYALLLAGLGLIGFLRRRAFAS